MKTTWFFLTIVLITSIETTQAKSQKNSIPICTKMQTDSLSLKELDYFWSEISRTVREGDFKGYKATYHNDAVVVFATNENKVSIPISVALENWRQGFIDTKNGKTKSNVEFRFSQKIESKTTAHETGIFRYTSSGMDGKPLASFVNFEALLIKKNNKWFMLMEYQKSIASEEDWNKLE